MTAIATQMVTDPVLKQLLLEYVEPRMAELFNRYSCPPTSYRELIHLEKCPEYYYLKVKYKKSEGGAYAYAFLVYFNGRVDC